MLFYAEKTYITAYAGTTFGLLEIIFKILFKLITVLGVVFGIMGVVHYASANAEGDGPAKNKAMAQIGAGVMIILASFLLDSQLTTILNTILQDW